MMKTMYTRLLTAIMLIATVTMVACKKSATKQAQYLPKDASVVLGFDGGSIEKKVKDDALSLDKFFSTITGDNKEVNEMQEKLKTFKNAGVDFKSPIYLAFRARNGNTNDYDVTLTAALKNVTEFEQLIKKEMKEVTVQKVDDISYIQQGTGDNGVIVGWNKDVVIAYNNHKPHTYDYPNPDNTTMSAPPSKENTTSDKSGALDALKKIFKQSEDESLMAIPEFKTLLGEKSDAVVWLNMSGFNTMAMQMPKMKSLLENNYLAAAVNFNNGEVVVDGKSYVSKELGEIYKKYTGPVVDLNLLQHYPTNNLNGLMMFSFKPAMIGDFLKLLGMEGLVNAGLMQAGVNLNDVLNLFKGDIAAAFSDFTIEEKPSPYDPTYMQKTPKAKWLVAIPLGSKEAVDKVMNIGIQQQKIRKEGNRYFPIGMPPNDNFAFSVDDKQIIIGSDSILIQQYMSGTGKITMPSALESTVKNKCAAMYVDINKILTAIPSLLVHEPASIAVLEKSKGVFKDMTMTADNYDGTCFKHKWTLRLNDSKENSIVQLYKYAQALVEIGFKKAIDMQPDPIANPSNIPEMSPKANDYKEEGINIDGKIINH